jgi:hypothetical protein
LIVALVHRDELKSHYDNYYQGRRDRDNDSGSTEAAMSQESLCHTDASLSGLD